MAVAAKPGAPEMRHMTSTEIADDLTERIRAGEYPPGTALPLARDLAKLYGCPKARIRRVMVQLTARGLVEYRAGLGNYVREGHPS